MMTQDTATAAEPPSPVMQARTMQGATWKTAKAVRGAPLLLDQGQGRAVRTATWHRGGQHQANVLSVRSVWGLIMGEKGDV